MARFCHLSDTDTTDEGGIFLQRKEVFPKKIWHGKEGHEAPTQYSIFLGGIGVPAGPLTGIVSRGFAVRAGIALVEHSIHEQATGILTSESTDVRVQILFQNKKKTPS